MQYHQLPIGLASVGNIFAAFVQYFIFHYIELSKSKHAFNPLNLYLLQTSNFLYCCSLFLFPPLLRFRLGESYPQEVAMTSKTERVG